MIKVIITVYLVIGLLCAGLMAFGVIYASTHDLGNKTAAMHKINNVINLLSVKDKIGLFLYLLKESIKMVLFWPIIMTKKPKHSTDEIITMMTEAEEKLSNVNNNTNESIDI